MKTNKMSVSIKVRELIIGMTPSISTILLKSTVITKTAVMLVSDVRAHT